ncbi:Tol-Pal system protein TolB [Bienertia sinuspersici]
MGKRRQVKGTPSIDKDVNYVPDENSVTDESDQENGTKTTGTKSYTGKLFGALVKDPLNAPLYKVEQFLQIPQENKDKMWQLVLDKFDIGLHDDQEEEERKKKYTQRRKFIMESLNKKYRNFRARLKSDYYDTEETDEDQLKEENMPKFVDKKDWEWLVKYFGSEEFQVINTFNCACDI